jgi:hypothetical protein
MFIIDALWESTHQTVHSPTAVKIDNLSYHFIELQGKGGCSMADLTLIGSKKRLHFVGQSFRTKESAARSKLGQWRKEYLNYLFSPLKHD